MIPILYEPYETEFTSNGLGRLRDCISCIVTEERNGIYECDFEYPVTGSLYEDITLGRIIAVKHDDTDDIQPFDIVSCARPINGVVTFHAVHVSYRQRFMTVTATNITSLSEAFNALKLAKPINGFNYETDKTSTGYVAAFDGVPRTVRSILGGVDGSILESYGGEYEWDKFTVRLWASRGTTRDFAIRYGVNMLDYNEEIDFSESYTAVIPYWVDDITGTVVQGSVVSSGQTPYNGIESCIPLNLTDRYDKKPTKATLDSAAASYMTTNKKWLPAQSIEVDFMRLQDVAGYEYLAPLLECKLCDTIKVIMPRYNMSGDFKIVRTVYDVLLDRFSSMELGTLSTSLSEALGIATDSDKQSGPVDYVAEQGSNDGWTYRKWASGKVEAWKIYSFTLASWTVWASPVRYMDKALTIPSGIFTTAPAMLATSRSNQFWVVDILASSTTAATARLATVASSAMATSLRIYAWQ